MQITGRQTAIYNLRSTRRGDTWPGMMIDVRIDGEPIDMTGGRARLHVRRDPDDGDILMSWDTEDGSVTVDEEFPSQVMFEPRRIMVSGRLQYDLEITLPSGRVVTPMAGRWNISKDVTY